jgi:hypothetical protein
LAEHTDASLPLAHIALSMPFAWPLRLLASLTLCLAVSACGAQTRTDALVPTRPADLRSTLQGHWSIIDADEAAVATLELDGGRFVLDTLERQMFGDWDVLEFVPNQSTIALQIDGFEQDGIREVYGAPDQWVLTLVFANLNRIFVVQPEAGWTRWDRHAAQ